jgi:hypothetical protein
MEGRGGEEAQGVAEKRVYQKYDFMMYFLLSETKVSQNVFLSIHLQQFESSS